MSVFSGGAFDADMPIHVCNGMWSGRSDSSNVNQHGLRGRQRPASPEEFGDDSYPPNNLRCCIIVSCGDERRVYTKPVSSGGLEWAKRIMITLPALTAKPTLTLDAGNDMQADRQFVAPRHQQWEKKLFTALLLFRR